MESRAKLPRTAAGKLGSQKGKPGTLAVDEPRQAADNPRDRWKSKCQVRSVAFISFDGRTWTDEPKLPEPRRPFVIWIDPTRYADVVDHLCEKSRRPNKAVRLWARLLSTLQPFGNEILADRAELARMLGVKPTVVSEIMTELEAFGAIYRKREGRRVRYFISPEPGTAQDETQAKTPQQVGRET